MPQKKKKNAPKNAYYFYMLDYKVKKESEGVVFRGGLKDVADAASSSWKGLDPKSKRYYENMAERAKVAGSGGTRYNTQGQTYEEAENERLEVERQRSIMMRVIMDSVQSGGREGLKSRRFYFIHVNHYGAMEDSHFIPCEVAVLAYSIEKGFQPENIFHEFIKNFELPNGYTFKAKSHMEATHQCPLPPYALGTCQIQQIIEKIWNLMHKNGDVEDGIPPPLYTLQQFLPEGVDFFAYIHDGYKCQATNPYRVYPLEELFYQMKKFGLKPEGQHLYFNGIEDRGFPYLTTAADILKGDIYDYAPNLACEFHEEQDVRQHCSKSYVIRWSYLFSDHLCANLDVQIKHVTHTPKSTDLNKIKITSQMEQLTLMEPEETNEPYGRGRPIEGRGKPTKGHMIPTSSSYDRYGESGPKTSQNVNDGPFKEVDFSQFQDDDESDDDDFEPLPPPKLTMEDAPLRQPKTPGKSSMMLDAMCSPTTSEAGGEMTYASQLLKQPVGRGRGRGLYLPSGNFIDGFNDD